MVAKTVIQLIGYTVNIYRYKAIGANATSSVISTTLESGINVHP